MRVKRPAGRKLLIASIGVASVSYVSCGGESESNSGNGQKDAAVFDVVANLVAPPEDAGKDTGVADVNVFDVVANLVAPPEDASSDSSSDAQGSDADVEDATVEDVNVFDVVANLVAPPPDGGD